MPSYTRTTKIDVDEDTAYAYLSKAENLPEYFPRITEVNKKSGDEVETTAVIDPPGQPEHEVHGTAWFKTDDASHKVTWGAEGPNDYHGELDFDPDGDGASSLRLSLSTEHDHPGIEESIDETLATIAKKLGSGS